MKGTAPILHDGQDERRAVELQNDPKNRAENVMIVDLLRNDLGKSRKRAKYTCLNRLKFPVSAVFGR